MNISFAHFIWLLSLKIDDFKFKYFLDKPQVIQEKILKKYLKDNRNTKYGKKYKFSKIKSVHEFQKHVPIVEYDDIKHYIDDIKFGKKNVLSSKDPLFFEETTGTNNISKLIPYNSILKKEFISAIGPWMLSLNRNFNGIFKGKSYWSISPVLKEKKTSFSTIKIGLESDAEYLNKIGLLLSKHLLLYIKPENLSEKFYINSLKKMYREKQLGFISVYSPSFLIQLNNILRNNWDKIIPKNDKISKNALWSDIFKNLRLVSCWLDSSSAQFMSEIQSFLGDIAIQPKGLLSTESIVSIPYVKNYNPLLAITSHFFEFLSQNDNQIYLSHNLKINEKYEVIISTGNGFMRYRTHDIIEVTNYFKSTPTIKFIGRNNKISDVVGEKVSEIFCIKILEKLEAKYKLLKYNAFFYLSKNNNIFNYNFAIYSSNNDLKINEIDNFIKSNFQKNLYYNQAVRLKQIDNLKTHFISEEFYHKIMNDFFGSRKIKDGDRKPPVLFNLDDSLELFFNN